ncbi:uncharacterized protein [Aristolochia californica]|uniref:uncharacterized protein n=1 Tax=Aristolochia californica TaxID=171875 RepID=UPI0035D91F57
MATSSNFGVRNSSTRSAIEEPSNPYYIHHSDNPEQVLVSQLLTGENYINWSCAMLIALSVKNKRNDPRIFQLKRELMNLRQDKDTQFWIVDSGATRHICSLAPAFISLHVVSHTTVTLPNHSQILVHFAGDVKLHFNLDLSTQRMIGKGDKVQDLYVLRAQCLNSASTAFVNNVSAHVWHNRLGHISFTKLDSLKDQLQSFVSTLAVHRPKSHPRARVCVFLGYPAGVKGYKFYDVEAKHVFISKDAVFYEDVFLFHTITSLDQSTDPFPDLVLPHSSIQVSSLPELGSSSIHDSPAISDVPVDDIPTNDIPTLVPSTSACSTFRQSTRKTHPPHYLQDYHCNLLVGSSPSPSVSYPISNFISYYALSDSHRQFALSASRQRYSKFSHVLINFGFLQSKFDYSLFNKGHGSSFVALLVYVDDIILTGPSSSAIAELKKFLHTQFKLKDLGCLKHFLGFEIAQSKQGIVLSQRHYTLQLLDDTGYWACKPTTVPMDPKLHLTATEGDLLPDITHYRRFVGKLLYLTLSRPDITFAVHKLTQFAAQPRLPHLKVVHHLLRYLKNSPGQGL